MEWLDVMSADDLAPGQVATVERETGDIVVWRTASGQVVACDARCPHQWAHLGSAGAVDGEELVCLSHFWRFDVSGMGSKLSATGRRDEKSPIATMSVRERMGRIELAVGTDCER
jgi:nitrite reductase/ring-hydroxylating ferredoxin subunit